MELTAAYLTESAASSCIQHPTSAVAHCHNNHNIRTIHVDTPESAEPMLLNRADMAYKTQLTKAAICISTAAQRQRWAHAGGCLYAAESAGSGVHPPLPLVGLQNGLEVPRFQKFNFLE